MIAAAQGKSCQVKFPPSQRDFEVHRFLVAEGGSTRAAATRFGVSQTRVRQLSRRVAEWAAEVLPPDAEAEVAGLLRVAEAAACDRLQHFYELTMEQWQATHQPRFLGLAIRVTLAEARLPARTFAIEAAAADAWDAAEGGESGTLDREAEEPRPMVAAVVNPPAGDCSPKNDSSASGPAHVRAERVATPPQPSKLERLLAGEMRPDDEQSARLRTLLSPPTSANSAGLGVAAEMLDLSVDDVLRRQQRRNRKAK